MFKLACAAALRPAACRPTANVRTCRAPLQHAPRRGPLAARAADVSRHTGKPPTLLLGLIRGGCGAARLASRGLLRRRRRRRLRLTPDAPDLARSRSCTPVTCLCAELVAAAHAPSLTLLCTAGFLGNLSGAGQAAPPAESVLGELFQRLLPGPAFFLPVLLYPAVNVTAALSAVHMATAVQAVAASPVVQVRARGCMGCGWPLPCWWWMADGGWPIVMPVSLAGWAAQCVPEAGACAACGKQHRLHQPARPPPCPPAHSPKTPLPLHWLHPQVLGPLSPLLQHLAGSQLSATLLAVAGSLATALFSFVAIPVMDWLLGRDLRAPSEVGDVFYPRGCSGARLLVTLPGWRWAARKPPTAGCCAQLMHAHLSSTVQADEAAVAQGGQDASYRCVLWAYAPLQLAGLAAACHILWCVRRGGAGVGAHRVLHCSCSGSCCHKQSLEPLTLPLPCPMGPTKQGP